MNRLNRIILFLHVIFFASCFAYAQPKSNDIIPFTDSLMMDFTAGGNCGASVLLVKNAEAVLLKGYGLARLSPKTDATQNTTYRLASISKQFTAMAILMLYEDKKLRISQNINDFFPDFPAYGKNITINHLVHHTSGIIDYEALLPTDDKETVGLESRPDSTQLLDKDVFNLIKNKTDSTYFRPGSKYKYSNTAYAFLALIVEKVSGLSFNQYLQEKIFKPLDMKNTIAYTRGKNTVNNRAYGCTATKNGYKESDQSYTSAVLGDGGIYCSVADYLKWYNALSGNKLVSAKNLQLAFTPAQLNNGKIVKTGYGFGWYQYIANLKKYTMHKGTTYGFSNIVMRFPKDDFCLLILTNKNEAISEVTKIATQIVNKACNNILKTSVSEQVFRMAYEKNGEAAIEQYKQLNLNCSNEYYFGENALVETAQKLIATNKTADALTIIKYNIELYPDCISNYKTAATIYYLLNKEKAAFEMLNLAKKHE